MTGGKKWLLVITDEQHDWIKMVSEKTSLKGSDIVRELLSRTMENEDKKFIASLANAQLRIEMQSLNNKVAAIEEQKRELKKRFSEVEKAVA